MPDETYRSSASTPIPSSSKDLEWTIALALHGTDATVANALDDLAPPSRTFTVVGTRATSLPECRSHHVFRQPSSRDTGVAFYVALAMVKRWAPEAVVTLVPAERSIAGYAEQIARAQGLAREMRDTVFAVRDLGVVAGTVDALWELGRAGAPHLMDILDSLVPLVGTRYEDEAVEYIYEAYMPVSFSRDIAQRAAHRMATVGVEGVEPTDFGRRLVPAIAMRA